MSKARALLRLPGGRRTKWAVLVFWLIVVALAGPLSGKLTGAEKNDAQAWLPAKAESTRVLNLQSTFQSPNVFPAVIVYDRPSGLTAADRHAIAQDIAGFTGVPGVVQHQVAGPFFATNGKAAQTLVPVNLGSKGWNGATAAVDKLRTIAHADAGGLAAHIAGPLGNAADSAKAFSGIDSTLLFATLAVVIVLLLITYRSPVLWLLPVMTAGIALVSAEALIYLLAAHAGLTVNGQSAGILNVLVFGAGTDYALLLTARYREELRRHQDRHEAMAVALRRAGPAIVASAGTVILSLLTLTIAELNSTKGMGPVLAIGVGVALLAMITLLPALLVIFGRWIFWPVEAGLRLCRADQQGVLGPRRPQDRGQAAYGLGRHRGRARDHGGRPDRAEGQRADRRRVLRGPSPGLGRGPEGDRPELPGRGRAAGHSGRHTVRGEPAADDLRGGARYHGRHGAAGARRARLPGRHADVGAGQPGRLHDHRPGARRRARRPRSARAGRRQHRGEP